MMCTSLLAALRQRSKYLLKFMVVPLAATMVPLSLAADVTVSDEALAFK
jgi:hypothetical protein